MRVLIVEDEALVALQIEVSLERAEHEVAGVADTLNDAVQIAEAESPELALVDICLAEGCNGLDVAEKLKKLGIPSLFVTGNCPGENRGDIALGCLHKPFNERQIAVAIAGAKRLLAGKKPLESGSELHFY